jgi:hypothetical protein
MLWTPVPAAGYLPGLPNGVYWWFLPHMDSEGRIAVVLSTGIVAVLGAVVLVVRSGWRVYASGPRR